jgi:hypothetical protein
LIYTGKKEQTEPTLSQPEPKDEGHVDMNRAKVGGFGVVIQKDFNVGFSSTEIASCIYFGAASW